MIDPRRVMLWSRRLLTAIVVSVVCWFLLSYSYRPHLRSHSFAFETESLDIWSREEFINEAVSVSIEDDFEFSDICDMCDAQEWDDSVVFKCVQVMGGIGNVKQMLLSCIRYAMGAGAGLIMPAISQRSSGDLSNLENGTVEMNHLFDQERFISRMNLACPQMKIFADVEELEQRGEVIETKLLQPSEYFQWPGHPLLSVRDQVTKLKDPVAQISLIPFGMVFQYYPICHDSESFASNFGQLLPLRLDVHHLAATILYEVATRFRLPIDPSLLISSPTESLFLGLHLRTSSDSLSWWPTYGEQAAHHLSTINSLAKDTTIPVIYAASGNLSSITAFAHAVRAIPASRSATSSPIPVLTKFDLLRGRDLDLLNEMTWDQQALVDYLVLIRSSYFMGMAESSFAWLIAVKRRVWTTTGSCGSRHRGLWTGYLLGSSYRDEFSDLMLWKAMGWEYKMWP